MTLMQSRISTGNQIVRNGLVLWLDASNYPGSGTTWTDISGKGNNGTLTNGPTFSSNNSGSLVFDGLDDYISCGNSASLNITSALTLSSWVYLTAWSGYPGIIGKGYSTTGGYSTHIRPDYSIWFEIDTSGGTRYNYNPTSVTIGLNGWYNVVATYDQSLMQIYINTVAAGAGLSTTTTIGTITANVEIGRLSGYGYFQGRISNSTIYNRALSATEITQNFNALRGRYGV